MKRPAAKFEVGELIITPGASAALAANQMTIDHLLARHQSGDWGEVNETVRAVNERGLSDHFNIHSTYPLADGRRLAVVTNRDRTATMVHLDPPHSRS
jgi:hypothetical protein